MWYLLLSILFSSGLFVIFRVFKHFTIDTKQAIVVNYLVAASVGYYLSESSFSFPRLPEKSWFLGAIFLGFLFVAIFNVMALTSQKNGLAVASVAAKMSLVVPIVFAVFVYKESLDFVQFLGVLIALISVYLTVVKANTTINRQYFLFPFLLFLGSGIIDTALKYVEKTQLQNNETSIFSATIFAIAFVFGVAHLLYLSVQKKVTFKIKNVVGGVILGVPNYFSIIFLLKALKKSGLESATLFTVNNVSIVLITSLLGVFLFKEKLEAKNWVGIILAIVSIVLMTKIKG